MVIKEPKYEQPDLSTQLQMLETGRIRQIESKVEAPHQQIALIRPGLDKIKNINCKLLQSANTFLSQHRSMCVSKDGSIIMEGKNRKENNLWLKCTRNGTNIWEVKIGNTVVCGLCCVSRNKEYLINTLGWRLEARDVTDGRVLHGCDVDFQPGRMCSTDDGSILVVNDSDNPCTLVKFKLTERDGVKLEKTNETINTQFSYVNGLTLLSSDNKKLVILTRWDSSTIQAINYETGAIEWKINGEKIYGKAIQPFGVCHDDLGHLFVADYDNNKVLVVSPEGKIKQKLLDLPRTAYYINFDVTQRKLLVDYKLANENILNIYDIEYITK